MKRIRFIWLLLLVVLGSFLLSGCTALKKQSFKLNEEKKHLIVDGKKSTELDSTSTIKNTSIESTSKQHEARSSFDKSVIDEDNKFWSYEPIDPSKAMEIRTEAGKVITKNAKKVYKENRKKTSANKGGNYSKDKVDITKKDIEEIISSSVAKIVDEKLMEFSESQSIIDQQSKVKVSTPWYIYLFGFLSVAMMIFLLLIYKQLSAFNRNVNLLNT